MFLYSDLWQIMAVKQVSSGVHREIGNDDTFDVIPGNAMTLRLKNVTDTDVTRFRCTFLSSFAAPKSIIEVEIKSESMWQCTNLFAEVVRSNVPPVFTFKYSASTLYSPQLKKKN